MQLQEVFVMATSIAPSPIFLEISDTPQIIQYLWLVSLQTLL